MKKLLLAAIAAAVIIPGAGCAHRRVVVFSGPRPAPAGYGWNGPAYRPDAGQVRLDTNVTEARVYLNGTYMGTVRDTRTMWLRRGVYTLEIHAAGRARFAERITVVPGRTIHVRPELYPAYRR